MTKERQGDINLMILILADEKLCDPSDIHSLLAKDFPNNYLVIEKISDELEIDLAEMYEYIIRRNFGGEITEQEVEESVVRVLLKVNKRIDKDIAECN